MRLEKTSYMGVYKLHESFAMVWVERTAAIRTFCHTETTAPAHLALELKKVFSVYLLCSKPKDPSCEGQMWGAGKGKGLYLPLRLDPDHFSVLDDDLLDGLVEHVGASIDCTEPATGKSPQHLQGWAGTTLPAPGISTWINPTSHLNLLKILCLNTSSISEQIQR